MKGFFKGAVFLLLFGVFLWWAELNVRDYYLRLLILFGVNSIVALGVNVTNGYSNIFSLGFGGVMLVAGYTSALLTLDPAYKAAVLRLPLWLERLQFPFPAALALAGLLGMLASVVLLLPAFRLRGQYFILASMGINIVVENLAENFRWLTNGNLGLRGIPRYTTVWWVYGILILCLFCIYRLMRSRYGRALVALSKDQDLAAVMGINVVRYKVMAFSIGCFISGIGASLWCHMILTINPKAFNLIYVFQIIAMLALGGIGTISGTLLGVAVVTVGSELLAPLQEGFSLMGWKVPPAFGAVNVFMAILLIVVMIKRPRGIMNGREIWEKRLS